MLLVRLAHAYFDLQSTTPQTLAYLLADSPVGLLAWLYERLVLWSDEYPWTEDESASSFSLLVIAHANAYP